MPVSFEENFCSYGVKSSVCLLAVVGVICSILAARDCNFISFVDTDGNPPDKADAPPFDSALSGNVGIFGYIITDVFNGGGPGTNGCVAYSKTFGQQTDYPSLATAQFCAIIAPIFGGLAAFAALVDLCVCNFNGSFMTSGLLFLIATGIQAGTFALVADPAFCLDDTELECHTGPGVYLSVAATVLYFISSVLMCCSPRGEPFIYSFGLRPRQKHSPPQPQPKVIVQPVIVHTPAPANETDLEKQSTKKTSKKKMKKKGGTHLSNPEEK